MNPHKIPCVIEKVKGMSMIVRNAGSESSIRLKEMAATLLNIEAPTKISTGAVA